MTENEYVPNRKIKSIHIVNFQNHKDSVIDLTNGLNLLVGSSDSGKSAVARAINFVIYNDYENEFVHSGEKVAEVSIEFVDGSIVRRTKGSNLNKVEFKYPYEPDFNKVVAFGTDYFEDILNFLCNPPKSKILGPLSYSDQSNKNFLIDLPSSQIPAVLSSLFGIDDLDEASSLLNKTALGMQKDIKSIQTKIDETNVKLDNDFLNLDDQLSKIESAIKSFELASNLEKLIIKKQSSSIQFDSINKRGIDAKNDLEKANSVINILQDNIKSIENLNDDLSKLSFLNESLSSKKDKINSTEKTLKYYRSITNGSFKKNIDEIDNLTNSISTMNNLQTSLDSKNSDISNTTKNLKYLTDQYSDLQKQYDTLVEEIKVNGLYCETCNKFGGELI